MERDATGAAPERPRQDRILLRDYVRTVDIGAFHEERGAPQRLRFGIELIVSPGARTGADEVDEILSYDSLVDAVDATLAEERVELLETLAERIALRSLQHPRAAQVRVTIEKLDRGPFALGVDILRHRPPAAPAAAPAPQTAAPWVVYLPAAVLDAPQLESWIAQIAAAGAPVVLSPSPLPSRPRVPGAPAAQRHIDLLSQDQVAWLLDATVPAARAAASRTEIEAVLRAGDLAVWVPSRMLLRAAETAGRAVDAPSEHAAWLATEIGAARLLGLGGDVQGGVSLELAEVLDLPASPAPFSTVL